MNFSAAESANIKDRVGLKPLEMPKQAELLVASDKHI